MRCRKCMFFTLLRFLLVCGNTSQVEYAYGDIYAKIEPSKLVSIISIDMVKRCVAAGCSNTNADGVACFISLDIRHFVENGINRCKELVPIGRMQPSTLFFVASILRMNALKRTPL